MKYEDALFEIDEDTGLAFFSSNDDSESVWASNVLRQTLHGTADGRLRLSVDGAPVGWTDVLACRHHLRQVLVVAAADGVPALRVQCALSRQAYCFRKLSRLTTCASSLMASSGSAFSCIGASEVSGSSSSSSMCSKRRPNSTEGSTKVRSAKNGM